MKWYRGPEGDQRLWFEEDEIELIVDDELRKAGCLPTPAAPVTDLERFIERHLRARLDQYAELEPEVLGLTQFTSGKPPAVSINRDLTGSALDDDGALPGLTGRWRATLAHEGAHILLHRILFEVDADQGSLFPDAGSDEPTSHGLMRCLKRDVGYAARASDWREVQANRGMAALLMPRKLFKKVAREELSKLGLTDLSSESRSASRLAHRLADHFAVSRQAASIRLETLRIVTPVGTSTLPPMAI